MINKTLGLHSLILMMAVATIPGLASASEAEWTTDFEAAMQTAEQEGKDLLVDFTGSDWCVWCIRLHNEVFEHEPFQLYANEHFVLVELDFPRRTHQSDDLREQNRALQERFGITGFPTVLLLDAEGKPYASTGYQRGGSESYVEHLRELKQVRLLRDENFAAAENAEGAEMARHLHAALQGIGQKLALAYYPDVIDQIIQADAENEAGLKAHYLAILNEIEQRAEFRGAMKLVSGDPEAALETVNGFLDREELVTPIRQEILTVKGHILHQTEQHEAAKQAYQEAIALDPESSRAGTTRQVMNHYYPNDAQ